MKNVAGVPDRTWRTGSKRSGWSWPKLTPKNQKSRGQFEAGEGARTLGELAPRDWGHSPAHNYSVTSDRVFRPVHTTKRNRHKNFDHLASFPFWTGGCIRVDINCISQRTIRPSTDKSSSSVVVEPPLTSPISSLWVTGHYR